MAGSEVDTPAVPVPNRGDIEGFDAALAKATAADRRGNPHATLYWLSECVRLDPEATSIWALLSRANLALGQADLALEQIQRTRPPRTASSLIDLGNALTMTGQREAAIGEYRAALRVSGSDPRLDAELGIGFATLGLLEEARPFLERACANLHRDSRIGAVVLANGVLDLAQRIPAAHGTGDALVITDNREITAMRHWTSLARNVSRDPFVHARADLLDEFASAAAQRRWVPALGFPRTVAVLGLATLILFGVAALARGMTVGALVLLLAVVVLLAVGRSARVPRWTVDQVRTGLGS